MDEFEDIIAYIDRAMKYLGNRWLEDVWPNQEGIKRTLCRDISTKMELKIDAWDVFLDVGACLGDTGIWTVEKGVRESYALPGNTAGRYRCNWRKCARTTNSI